MTKTTKRLVLAGLQLLRGDDYERALVAFRSLSADQMQEPYGQSGQTRQEILDGYRSHVQAVEAAIDEVTRLDES